MGPIGWLATIGCCLIGAAVSLWGLTEINKYLTIWLVGVPGAMLLVFGGALELQRLIPRPEPPPVIQPSPAAVDRPIVVAPDIGKIMLKDKNGRATRPYMHFTVENFGRSAAVLRRVQGRFAMIARPLTKEKLEGSNTGTPGVTEIQSWTSSKTLGPGQSAEVDPFFLPINIKLEAYEGYGRPRLDGPDELFLFLTIEYEELGGKPWTSFTCWKYEHPSHGIFARCGGQEWNYETEGK